MLQGEDGGGDGGGGGGSLPEKGEERIAAVARVSPNPNLCVPLELPLACLLSPFL